MRAMSDGERELWNEAQIDAAPTYTQLADRVRRTRKMRSLSCGHTVPAGTVYREIVAIVDGEFTVQHDCDRCYAELIGPTEADIEAMRAEEREAIESYERTA